MLILNLIAEFYSTEVTAEALNTEICAEYMLYPEVAAISEMICVVP